MPKSATPAAIRAVPHGVLNGYCPLHGTVVACPVGPSVAAPAV